MFKVSKQLSWQENFQVDTDIIYIYKYNMLVLLVQCLVHAFFLFVQPLKVKLDSGDVNSVTNRDLQTKFSLIFNLSLVSLLCSS